MSATSVSERTLIPDLVAEYPQARAVLDRYFESPLQADAYLAGAPIMVSETIKVLTAKGVPAGRIHHDPVKVE